MNISRAKSVLGQHGPLLWLMVQREMRSRYAGSALGALWAYVQPLLTVAIYFLVFDVVFAMRMGEHAPTERVGTYLVVGALPWLGFAEGLSRGASSLIDSAGILQKNALPPVLFVLRSVIASWLAFMPIMVLLAVLYGFITGHWKSLAIMPLLLVLQLALTYLVAYVLAILTAATRDTTQVLSFALGVGIFLSPVLFPLSLFPEPWQWALYLNPMSCWVMAYQSVMLSGQWPPVHLWGVMLGWLSVLALVLAWLSRNSREELVDWL
jgi:lipopolysaccharide transport system permease protein